MKIQQAPTPPTPPRPRPEPARPDPVEIWAQGLKDQIPEGRCLIVESPDGQQYRINGTKISTHEGRLSNVTQFFGAAVQEIQAAIAAGPNLALLGATEVVKPMVLNNAPAAVVSQIDSWYQPAVQGVSIALAALSFSQKYRALQQRRAIGMMSSPMQKVGLAMSALHVGTSAVGLAGLAGAAISPTLQAYAPLATGIALAGNVACFGFNWLEYFQNRSQTLHPLGDDHRPPQA